ncbi:MAG: 5-histidylcysteine sulfoxide synthase [Campylobacterota bacterium]|nr:5-histidylcysteine sulfoxide synthase [Campylobacterota bacterium]
MSQLSMLPITLDGDNVTTKRQEIRDYFHNTYALFELLFTMLKDDSVFYKQSEITRHPMIFYYGHTATFFINKLILGGVITKRINGDFESMFAIGVDEMSWDDMDKTHYSWPKVRDVKVYRDAVKTAVDNLIMTLPMTLPIKQDDPFWIILMGIEHERIHIETSSVLHRQLDITDVQCIDALKCSTNYGDAPSNKLIKVDAGSVNLAKERSHNLYGWDNEYGQSNIHVNAFEASKFLVSNGEYLDFVTDGGYANSIYWDDEGKKFLDITGAQHPPFWVKQDDGSFKYRTLSQEISMPQNWPVDVNQLEAMAFCRWKSKRDDVTYTLPSEAEWFRLYELSGLSDENDFNIYRANLNLAHYASATAVDEFGFGAFYDIVGNVWQWTSTPIDGFEGFKVHPIYDDFSTPTFDGKHNLIKGGSFISSGNEIMKHSRYAFRRHFYQHAGFRYVVDGGAVKSEKNIYETDSLVSQYCDFQYQEGYFEAANFAKKCAELSVEYVNDLQQVKALDIGCATGRSSFELARYCNEVAGIDFSARFIQVGVTMKNSGVIHYERQEEGDFKSKVSVTLEALDLQEVASSVNFFQGDACNLKAHFSGYNLIMANNLIDRLYEPKLFLQDIHKRLNDKGILVLTSPYTWDESYTKKEFWLGGYCDETGEKVYTLDGLKSLLLKNFELLNTHDVPFVIRETPRKFQHTVSQMSVWRKR